MTAKCAVTCRQNHVAPAPEGSEFPYVRVHAADCPANPANRTTVDRRFPETRAELDAQVAAAEVKYGPLVAKLTAGDLLGLVNVCSLALAHLRLEAHSEDIRRGARPPGTNIGR